MILLYLYVYIIIIIIHIIIIILITYLSYSTVFINAHLYISISQTTPLEHTSTQSARKQKFNHTHRARELATTTKNDHTQ